MKISDNDRVEIERELGKRSFKHFVQMAWHIIEPATPLVWGWALEAECEHLQAVAEGRMNRLLMNVPPGMSKSTLVSVMFAAWQWTREEWRGRRFLGTAHKEPLAIRDSMKCRRIVSSAWYQERWPFQLMKDNDAKLRFENDMNGWREAMAFTSLTGSRGDVLTIDDPISVDDANSKAALLEAKTTFLETVPTRLNNKDSAIIVVMQRVNEEDTSGVILDKLPGEYVHLRLPMRFEANDPCVTPIFKDPRTVDGELLFPERFDEDTLHKIELSLGSYATAGQMQQRPAPRGGGIYKAEWWRYYNELPKLQFRNIYADTAQKTAEQNDFCVFQCWGKTYDGRAVLVDQIRDKWEAPQLLVNARAFWNKHNDPEIFGVNDFGTLRKMKIEDKSSGTGLIQQLRQGDPQNGVASIPVAEIPRDRDKVSRAYDTTPKIEAGLVLIPAAASFLSDYLKEFGLFPNGSNDDMIDPTMDAVADLLGGGIRDFSGIL